MDAEVIEKLSQLPLEERGNPEYTLRLNSLAEEALGPGEDAASARKALARLMGLDPVNFTYFLTRWRAFRSPSADPPLYLHGGGTTPPSDAWPAYSTATAPAELMKQIPWRNYADLKTEAYRKAGQQGVLWVKKMMAGTGSSLQRREYLAQARGIDPSNVSIGAKGTDLFIHLESGVTLSLAEAQILRSAFAAKRGDFGGVIFRDIVGPETAACISDLWDRPSQPDPSETYRDWIQQWGNAAHSGSSFQAHLPTVGPDGRLTYLRHAPGGHGLFGVEELRIAALGETPRDLPPGLQGKPLISAIGNGEDLSSEPDPHMVGWMISESIPIAMVTTTKMPVDSKGGQIAVVVPASGKAPYVTIVEVAQAEASGQKDLFQQLGLRDGDNIAFFNTNLSLYNHDVLGPKLKQLYAELGEERFMEIVAPDLIRNPKQQKDSDGEVRTYVQLEGAKGSVLLNLDRYWRSRFGEPLVHFVNVEPRDRTRFFSPVKVPFDFFMQFASDRFRFDEQKMELRDQRPGELPAVSLTGSVSRPKYYTHLHHVLNAFKDTRVRDMDSLTVRGCIRLSGVVLRGKVEIETSSDEEVDVGVAVAKQVPVEDGLPVLENLRVEIAEKTRLVPLRD